MEIKRELTRQKAALAPKLAEMRALREQADALDPEHRALKATADALAKQFETRCAEAVREVTRLREEVGAQESRLFELGVLSALTDADALGLRPHPQPDAVKRAYRALAKRLHPDKCTAPRASAAFQRILRAYQTLNGNAS